MGPKPLMVYVCFVPRPRASVVIAAVTETHRMPAERDDSRRARKMSLTEVRTFSLASIFMIPIIIFRTDDDSCPASLALEYDGNDDTVLGILIRSVEHRASAPLFRWLWACHREIPQSRRESF